MNLTQIRRANTALAGESAARRETTLTVADLYTRSGLAAADAGQPERAALWFAQAAVTAASGDPARLSANRLRAAACSPPSGTAA